MSVAADRFAAFHGDAQPACRSHGSSLRLRPAPFAVGWMAVTGLAGLMAVVATQWIGAAVDPLLAGLVADLAGAPHIVDFGAAGFGR